MDKKEIKADDKLKENITKILMPQLTNAYQDNHDYFGKICDICEKVIEDNIERREVFFEENRTDLLASLSNVEGFFDEKEFSFLWDNSDEEDIIQMDVSEGINNFFETYYKQIHQKIFNKLKEKRKGTPWSWKSERFRKAKSQASPNSERSYCFPAARAVLYIFRRSPTPTSTTSTTI